MVAALRRDSLPCAQFVWIVLHLHQFLTKLFLGGPNWSIMDESRWFCSHIKSVVTPDYEGIFSSLSRRASSPLQGRITRRTRAASVCVRAAVVTHPCSVRVTFWHFQTGWEERRTKQRPLFLWSPSIHKKIQILCAPPSSKRLLWLPWRLFHSPNKGVFYESSAAFFKESLLFPTRWPQEFALLALCSHNNTTARWNFTSSPAALAFWSKQEAMVI